MDRGRLVSQRLPRGLSTAEVNANSSWQIVLLTSAQAPPKNVASTSAAISIRGLSAGLSYARGRALRESPMGKRRLPGPLSVVQKPGGWKVPDASRHTLCQVNAREMPQAAVSITEQ